MILEKKQLWFLWIGLGLFIAAFAWDSFFSSERNIERYKTTIEEYLHKQEAEIEDIFSSNGKVLNDPHFMERRLMNPLTTLRQDSAAMNKLQQKPYNICLFNEDSAIFWSRNIALPSKKDLVDTAINKTYIKLLELCGSQYELRYRTILLKNGRKYTLAAVIPIKKSFMQTAGKYVSNYFVASSLIPEKLTISDKPTLTGMRAKVKLVTFDGIPLGLATMEESYDSVHDYGVLVCLLLGFLLLGFFADKLSKQILIENKESTWGISFFIGALVLLRLCVFLVEQESIQLLPSLEMKSIQVDNAIFINSLSSFLIHTAFLFWFATFFNKEFRLSDYSQRSNSFKCGLAIIFYTAVAMLNILSIGVFNDLVNHFGDILIFSDVTNMNMKSILVLIGLGVLQLSIFLISHRLVSCANKLNLTNWQLTGVITTAVTFGVGLYQMYGFSSSVPAYGYAFILLAYMVLFTKYVREYKPGLIWLMMWIIIITFFQMVFVAQFNEQKEFKRLKGYAATLANEDDAIAEKHIKIMSDKFLNDAVLQSWTSGDTQRIMARIVNNYKDDDYLINHYSLKYFGIKRTNDLVFTSDSALNITDFQLHYSTATPYTDDKRSRIWIDKDRNFAFLTVIDLPLSKDNSLKICFEFKRLDMTLSPVFTDIVATQDFKKIENLNEYNYAVYGLNGEVRERNQTTFYPNAINPLSNDLPSKQQMLKKPPMKGDYLELVYRSESGVIVYIGRTVPLISQNFNLWFLFFIFMVAILIAFTAINHHFKFLPEAINLTFSIALNTSLINRLFIRFVGLLIGSYLVLFFFTLSYFKKVSDNFYTIDFENKTNIIAPKLERELNDMKQGNLISDDKCVTNLLIRESAEYQTSINFFTPTGELFATTDENVFAHGFLFRHMNPIALMNLRATTSEKIFMAEEQIGKLSYKTKFKSIIDTSNKQILGYIEMPFYSRDRRIRTGTIDLSGNVGFFFLVLFFVCVGLIYLWTNNSLKPIQNVAKKLRDFRLDKQTGNEFIEWSNQDEIGDLIAAYNEKVQDLQETAPKLAEAERESAWRDMARQVAHEIRNPLTPMKLTVQHVEMLREQGSEHLEEYAVRSNKVLLDQIANLEKIVIEFHDFARMPKKANNQLFPLNDLVTNVASLFEQQSEETNHVKVLMSPPKERFLIYGDRILLTSAFNNLMKNAIQAIPKEMNGKEHDGKIRINLYREANRAIVKISDNGEGIPVDIQDKIFNPNFTTKSYGTGVGLLLTKNIIQSVNGKIWFESVVGQGTDFFIEFDIENVEEQQDAQPSVIQLIK